MASGSSGSTTPSPVKEASSTYEDVAVDPERFIAALENLHGSMGTEFTIPTTGGTKIDLHRHCVEVTSRGGIEKFKASPEIQATGPQRTPTSAVESPGASIYPYPVKGVIEGTFGSGYLFSATVGSKKVKGVLYEDQLNDPLKLSQTPQQYGVSTNKSDDVSAAQGVQRRRRRKKCEIRRRDPALPKPKRCAYNYFFADQHARLKVDHPKGTDITRMIGELWKNATESDKAVYREKANGDRERYRLEMEDSQKRSETVEVIINAVPLQQVSPEDAGIAEENANIDETMTEMST